MLRVLVIVVACACNGSQPARDAAPSCTVAANDKPSFTPSDRLRPIYWTAPDGLDLQREIMDQVLGASCVIYDRWCFPYPLLHGSVAFLDAACTQPVFVGGPGLAGRVTFRYGVPPHVLVELGNEIVPAPALLCRPSDLPPGGHVYALRALAPLKSNVVEFTTAFRTLTADDDALVARGDDCSELFVNIVRKGPGPTLFPKLTITGEQRWLPTAATLGAEPVCFASYAVVPESIFSVIDSVGRVVAVYRSIDRGSCSGGESYARGTEIPLNELELATPEDIGGTRLVRTVPTHGGFPVLYEDAFVEDITVHDKSLGIDCAPDTAADATSRCLPMPIDVSGVFDSTSYSLRPGFVGFTDAACTQPILVVPSSAPTPGFAREPADAWGAASSKVYQIGNAVSRPTTIYAQPNVLGTCEPIVLDDGFVFRAASEAAPALFSPIAREVR